jgi:hypothetical protein
MAEVEELPALKGLLKTFMERERLWGTIQDPGLTAKCQEVFHLCPGSL